MRRTVAGAGDGANGIGILVQSAAEALVGDIKEWDQLPADQHLNHAIPLLAGEIGPRRVMAARVKQHNAARRQLLEGGEHSGEIHPAGGPVEPGIGMYLKAGAGKDGNVVLPGWIADPDRGVGEVALEEISAHL
ncbi:hypothetical protein NUBL8589_41970 [Klebsiella pneumoniae]|nr:hypothetical protein NUBL8589_41970 [Klebsiella pneumoniae]